MDADRPQTAEQAMELALDWANGKRSHTNIIMDMEPGPEHRQDTLRIINEMDARTAEMWANIAASMVSMAPQVVSRPARPDLAKLAAKAVSRAHDGPLWDPRPIEDK
jgi:hypothetical protein